MKKVRIAIVFPPFYFIREGNIIINNGLNFYEISFVVIINISNTTLSEQVDLQVLPVLFQVCPLGQLSTYSGLSSLQAQR